MGHEVSICHADKVFQSVQMAHTSVLNQERDCDIGEKNLSKVGTP